MISSYYNSNISKLFTDLPKSIFLHRVPMIYDELTNCDILFIGINPSFIETRKSFQFIKTNCTKDPVTKYLSNLSSIDYNNIFYDLDRFTENVEMLGHIHLVFKKNYSYFNKFKFISEELNLSVGHLDLFPIRETSQKIVSKVIDQNPDFRDASIDIFLKTIKLISPKAIVIENTLVRDILLKQTSKEIKEYFPSYDYKFFKNNHFGTPVNSSGVAIYYTSMLTGQRAIDLGSYHRLLWSLNRFFD